MKNELTKETKLEKTNLLEITKHITENHKNFVVSNVNNHCLRIAVFTGEYEWHFHSNSDELFMVVEGELLVDFQNQETIALKPNDTLLIPAGTIHRTRALKRTVNLCFEDLEADTVIVE
ncbi:cupin domain-containing protein [Bacillus sp. BP-3]|uniref:cupin domain-containing protein n=1 Tax=Bacillus sp. BP-3 TaxID=3022773 RepID=UPI00232F6C9C|nr:cupin domain-containing protein [Bacillus sp. BP-3]MDC2863039.1 cupin domain-containing protein [Bacillus sp. BP-3]